MKKTNISKVSAAVATAFEEDYTSENSSKTGYEDRCTIIKKYLNNLKTFEKLSQKKILNKCKSLDFDKEKAENSKNFLSFNNEIAEESVYMNLSTEKEYKFGIFYDENQEEKQNISILTPSGIEIEIEEIREKFEFIEIDDEDYEKVRIKCKDIKNVLILKKSFEDGVFVNEFDNEIDPQPNIHFVDLEIIEVLKDNPSIGIFKHKNTGDILRIMRNFQNAKVVKDNCRSSGYNQYLLNSRREFLETTGVKDGHPMFWKFEDPRIKHGSFSSYLPSNKTEKNPVFDSNQV